MRWALIAWLARVGALVGVTSLISVQGTALPPTEVLLRGDTASDVLVVEHAVHEPSTVDGNDSDLLAWAATYHDQNATHDHQPPSYLCADCFLVVGVKTRAVRGFSARQRIRASWAHPAITQRARTRVVFLGCEPNPAQESDADANANATQHALALEKQVYGGDLLTHELGGCVDAYDRLVDKLLAFFHWTTMHFASAAYVMVADDDVYVRLDYVTAMLHDAATPRRRYYAGQVLASQFRRPISPMRDRTSKYFLSSDQYALATLPPFAIGAHYVLSADVAGFLGKNRDVLRPVGVLEDVSVGLWLLSLLQVRPIHVPQFRCTTHSQCHNSIASYGELSLVGMQQIHANVLRGDAFCTDFSFATWASPDILEPPRRTFRPRDDVTYEWALRVCPHSRVVKIETTAHLLEPLGTLTVPSVVLTPSMESFVPFCTQLHDAAALQHRRLPLMLCDDLTDQLRAFLQHHPLAKTALLALATSNLPPLAVMSAAVSAWLSPRVLRWRALVESLLVEIYPDVHVFVVDELHIGDPTAQDDIDFLVVSAAELPTLRDGPFSQRRWVFTDASDALQDLLSVPSTVDLVGERRSPLFFSVDHASPNAVYVPLVSMVFSDSAVHSPLALLQPSSERGATFHSVESFAVGQCPARAAALLTLLGEDATSHTGCTLASTDPTDFNASGYTSPETLFAFDAAVARYTQTKFVLAFETDQSTPGFIAGTIAAAFLAGSVPVYDGDESTISRLFNPNAFISCGRFVSLQQCAEWVAAVHRSPTLYAQMRSERPIVSETAFFDVFSWHPDVLRHWRRSRPDAHRQRSVAEQLRERIHTAALTSGIGGSIDKDNDSSGSSGNMAAWQHGSSGSANAFDASALRAALFASEDMTGVSNERDAKVVAEEPFFQYLEAFPMFSDSQFAELVGRSAS